MNSLEKALKQAEREVAASVKAVVDGYESRIDALERRLHHLEDIVREILSRTPRFERVETMPLMAGTDRAERVREGQAEGKNVVGASVGLGGSERSNTGGDGNTSSV